MIIYQISPFRAHIRTRYIRIHVEVYSIICTHSRTDIAHQYPHNNSSIPMRRTKGRIVNDFQQIFLFKDPGKKKTFIKVYTYYINIPSISCDVRDRNENAYFEILYIRTHNICCIRIRLDFKSGKRSHGTYRNFVYIHTIWVLCVWCVFIGSKRYIILGLYRLNNIYAYIYTLQPSLAGN